MINEGVSGEGGELVRVWKSDSREKCH